MSLPQVILISLGGTITMTSSAAGGVAPTLNADDLVRSAPAIKHLANIETFSPMRVPSASITLDNLIELAAVIDDYFAKGMDGAVVIQGTDTIEESAYVLDLLVKSDKPVVITGAMRSPETPGADGPANLLAATTVAASPRGAGLGTLVVLNDEVHAARFVKKSHTALTSAFTSSVAGPIGYVIEGEVKFHSRPARPRPVDGIRPGKSAAVALLKMSLGDDGRLLKALPELRYQGVVIEGMGAGHVPAIAVPAVEEVARVMPVVLSTRVHAGPSFTRTYGYSGSERDLLERGVIPAGPLTGLQARLLLALLLCSVSRGNIAYAFQQHVSDYGA
jgi:L-asparaginase